MINTLCPGWVAVLGAGVRGAGVCEPLLPLHISLHHGQLHPGAAPGEAIAELLQNTDIRKNIFIKAQSKPADNGILCLVSPLIHLYEWLPLHVHGDDTNTTDMDSALLSQLRTRHSSM